MNIVNRNSDSCSLLISSLEDVSTNYESSSPFIQILVLKPNEKDLELHN